MRRGTITLLLSLVVTLSLVGPALARQSITFWLMPNAPDGIYVPWLDGQIAKFKDETGIQVNYEIVGWGDAWSRISTALVTGEGVDVFQAGTTWNPQFAATGGLAEIDIAGFGGAGAFMRANLDSTKYKGRYYGVPWFAETRALLYNKDLFAKAGVEPPRTYGELHEVGRRIVATFGEGSAIAVAGTNAWDQADAAFISGNVAMAFMGPWNIAGIEVQNPGLNYGVVEPPAGPAGRASFSGGSNLVILRDSPNKEAAEAWIRYLLRPEVLADYTKNLSHMLPATLQAFEDPYYETGVWKTFKTTLGYATAYPPLGVWGDIENAIVGEFRQILTDYVEGRLQGVQRYLDAAAGQVNRALARER